MTQFAKRGDAVVVSGCGFGVVLCVDRKGVAYILLQNGSVRFVPAWLAAATARVLRGLEVTGRPS